MSVIKWLSAFVYFVLFTPVAVLVRALNKDLLQLTANPNAASYWTERRDSERIADRLKQQS